MFCYINAYNVWHSFKFRRRCCIFENLIQDKKKYIKCSVYITQNCPITLQPHEETRRRQLDVWADLFLRYLKHLKKNHLNTNENSFALFHNEAINRRLSHDTITKVLEQLESSGHGQPLDKRRTEWLIFWHTLDEYANMIHDWVQETGSTGSVCTLYEIVNGENSEHTDFYGIDEDVILRALRLLEERGKCEIIEIDGSYGAKFF